MPILIAGLQNRVKNSAAYAEELGLMLIANGEELPYLLTSQGEQIPAGLEVPTIGSITDAGAGNLTEGEWMAYHTVAVGENTMPLVAAKIYSNPSQINSIQITPGFGDKNNRIPTAGVDSPLVTHIYFFRTALFATELLALTAAAAGLLYYVGKVVNVPGPLELIDDLLVNIGNEQIQLINFTVPQFRFVIWDGNYFWGFANHAFRANATWALDGSFTLNNPAIDKFWGGRDGQFLTFDGISSGGVDNRGTFSFLQTGDYTGQATDAAGNFLTLPTAATGDIVIIGPSANLYRSGYRNPFQWGYLHNIAGVYVPELWEYKVSGSLGTAIAIVPDQQLLKLDMEFPALCVTFSLQGAATDIFATTKRQVSRLHSVTSHFSQFNAVSKGRQVLWGMDWKNLAIIESDGYTQVPVSGPISILLRKLSKNRSLHLLSHGIYDPVTEINAMWLSTSAADATTPATMFDLCVYQHAPTGFWGVFSDYGILCSAVIEDPATSQRNTLVGTETGFLGKAFDLTTHGNWLPTDSPFTGQIQAATENTITRSEGQDDFNPLDAGLIGNFCIVTNPQGLNPQVFRIIGATFDTLTFSSSFVEIPPTTDDPGLILGQAQFFIGLIELRMVKYFDDGEPTIDKAPREFWSTIVDCDSPQIEFHPEHADIPTVAVPLQQDADLDAWFCKNGFPTGKGKTFGLSLVERSYLPTKVYNITIK